MPGGSLPCVEEPREASADHRAAPVVAGVWELLEFRSVDDGGTVTGRPLGESPRGLLIYTPGGWMSGQVAAAGRPAVDSAGPLGGPADQRAAAYSTYLAYWGRYAITGNRIIHQVDGSLIPGWAGLEQVRYFSLSGDVLVLRTPPMQVAGAMTTGELTWRRAETW